MLSGRVGQRYQMVAQVRVAQKRRIRCAPLGRKRDYYFESRPRLNKTMYGTLCRSPPNPIHRYPSQNAEGRSRMKAALCRISISAKPFIRENIKHLSERTIASIEGEMKALSSAHKVRRFIPREAATRRAILSADITTAMGRSSSIEYCAKGKKRSALCRSGRRTSWQIHSYTWN